MTFRKDQQLAMNDFGIWNMCSLMVCIKIRYLIVGQSRLNFTKQTVYPRKSMLFYFLSIKKNSH